MTRKKEKKVRKLSDTMVSDREKALLSESNLLFKTVTEQSPNMIFINKGGKIVYVNHKCVEVMGYTKKEFLSPSFDFIKLIAPESTKTASGNFYLQMKGQEIGPYEYLLVNQKGEKIDAIITSKIIEYQGERAILGIVTDITDRKRAEKALSDSEENYRSLISEMCNGFALIKIIFDQKMRPWIVAFLK